MARQYIPARYVWSWSSLTGSVLGLLEHVGLPADSVLVGCLLGETMRSSGPPDVAGSAPATVDDQTELFAPTGYPPRSLVNLNEPLQALGLDATLHERDLSRERPPRFFTRRLKAALNAERPLIAYGAGRAVGPSVPPAEFGLIVGYDDERRAYRVDGPLSAEVDAWLPFDELGGSPLTAAVDRRWLAVIDASVDDPQPDRVAALARSAALDAAGPRGLERWIELLETDLPIDPQGHAWWAQGLAAGRAEAAQFWGRCARSLPGLTSVADLIQREALMLSRFATLHPYPTGGDSGSAVGRTLSARTLIEALALEREAIDRLAAATVPNSLTLAPPS